MDADSSSRPSPQRNIAVDKHKQDLFVSALIKLCLCRYYFSINRTPEKRTVVVGL